MHFGISRLQQLFSKNNSSVSRWVYTDCYLEVSPMVAQDCRALIEAIRPRELGFKTDIQLFERRALITSAAKMSA